MCPPIPIGGFFLYSRVFTPEALSQIPMLHCQFNWNIEWTSNLEILCPVESGLAKGIPQQAKNECWRETIAAAHVSLAILKIQLPAIILSTTG